MNYSRKHVSEFALPKLSKSLRTAVCHRSNVPAVWLGHRAIRLALEPELELEVQPGFLFPRRDRILVARRPRCPDSNIWSRTICWCCQSPHSPCTPDLSKESPMGDQAINRLSEWFWSPFEKKIRHNKTILSPSWGCHFCCCINFVYSVVQLSLFLPPPSDSVSPFCYNCSINPWQKTPQTPTNIWLLLAFILGSGMIAVVSSDINMTPGWIC